MKLRRRRWVGISALMAQPPFIVAAAGTGGKQLFGLQVARGWNSPELERLTDRTAHRPENPFGPTTRSQCLQESDIVKPAARSDWANNRPRMSETSPMKRPNFFIIGAPKCGTTSLAAWLAEHPEIFFSPTKEPHFFNTDHRRFINTLQAYESLFAGASDSHRAVGEASVWYMYSTAAVSNILAYNADARFIVMLRNPIEMAPSLHEELVFTGREDVKDFREAWTLQELRRNGEHLPPMVWEPKYVQYGALCSLGVQLDRVLQTVRRDRVKIILLEDLAARPSAIYRSVLEFLGVDDDHRQDFTVRNPAKKRRSEGLLRLAWLSVTIKNALGIEGGLGLWKHVDAWNRVDRKRAPIDPQTRAMLRDYFGPDIERLQVLIGRDLAHWLA